jgi:hypothetical protein
MHGVQYIKHSIQSWNSITPKIIILIIVPYPHTYCGTINQLHKKFNIHFLSYQFNTHIFKKQTKW